MAEKDMEFMYCPRCGTKGTLEYRNCRHWVCESCGFDLYNNVAASVATILRDKDNRVLFIVREKEPRKGYLALPGGFVDPDESAESAARRECKEEAGIEPEQLSFLCSSPNTYEYKQMVYKTCDIFFTGKLPEKQAEGNLLEYLTPQKGEVTDFVLESVRTKEDIARLPIAFPSAVQALQKWLENNP